jgi:hypothetical protein
MKEGNQSSQITDTKERDQREMSTTVFFFFSDSSNEQEVGEGFLGVGEFNSNVACGKVDYEMYFQTVQDRFYFNI